jgi:pectinesterase
MRAYPRWLILFGCVVVSGLALMTGFERAPAAEKSETSPVSEKKPDSPKIPAGLALLADQVYCIPDEDTKLMADILLPKAGKGPHPTVICLHGGGWVKGSRKTNLPIMIKLAEAGYAAVSVQYRFAHQAPFPAAVNDVKCAVRWLRANAGIYNLDVDRFAALGYSSGGQLASLLGLTTPLDGLEGKGGFNGYPSDVRRF